MNLGKNFHGATMGNNNHSSASFGLSILLPRCCRVAQLHFQRPQVVFFFIFFFSNTSTRLGPVDSPINSPGPP